MEVSPMGMYASASVSQMRVFLASVTRVPARIRIAVSWASEIENRTLQVAAFAGREPICVKSARASRFSPSALLGTFWFPV
jgi:hypothetical protein